MCFNSRKHDTSSCLVDNVEWSVTSMTRDHHPKSWNLDGMMGQNLTVNLSWVSPVCWVHSFLLETTCLLNNRAQQNINSINLAEALLDQISVEGILYPIRFVCRSNFVAIVIFHLILEAKFIDNQQGRKMRLSIMASSCWCPSMKHAPVVSSWVWKSTLQLETCVSYFISPGLLLVSFQSKQLRNLGLLWPCSKTMALMISSLNPRCKIMCPRFTLYLLASRFGPKY